MKNVTLIAINSAMLLNRDFNYNPGDFDIPLKLNYMHSPIIALASLLE